MAIVAGALVAKAGMGLYQQHKGKKDKQAAEKEALQVREDMGNTKYADYNQAYYEELKRRSDVGMPDEQRLAMEQGADRAAGVGLSVSDDRRGGMMGVGRAAASLSDSYRNIGLADVAEQNANAQQMLGEMSNRGQSTYNEQQNLLGMDLANARSLRQEGIQRQQAGRQEFNNSIDQGLNVAMAAGQMMTGMPMGQTPTGGGGGMNQAPPQQSYNMDNYYDYQNSGNTRMA